MRTNQHKSTAETLCWYAAHDAGRVGRRVAPESATAAFSDRNDGQQGFQQLANISVNPRYPREN